jgi:hypothetical protein
VGQVFTVQTVSACAGAARGRPRQTTSHSVQWRETTTAGVAPAWATRCLPGWLRADLVREEGVSRGEGSDTGRDGVRTLKPRGCRRITRGARGARAVAV